MGRWVTKCPRRVPGLSGLRRIVKSFSLETLFSPWLTPILHFLCFSIFSKVLLESAGLWSPGFM